MPKPLIDHVAKILTACLVAAFPTSYGVSSPPPNGDHYQPGPSGVWFSAPGAEAMIEVRPHPDFFLGGGARGLKVQCYAVEKLLPAAKIANVCCEWLLLAHPVNFVIFTFY